MNYKNNYNSSTRSGSHRNWWDFKMKHNFKKHKGYTYICFTLIKKKNLLSRIQFTFFFWLCAMWSLKLSVITIAIGYVNYQSLTLTVAHSGDDSLVFQETDLDQKLCHFNNKKINKLKKNKKQIGKKKQTLAVSFTWMWK